MDTYTYRIGEDIYINLTNRCTNDCTFCVRRKGDGVSGYHLWMEQEPTAQQVIELLGAEQRNVVFCGFGEPTIKLDELKEIAQFVKSYGGKVRLNTNGHANAIHGRNVAQELRGLVDVVSISLNEATAQKYERVVHSEYGEQGYDHMLEFARACVKEGIRVVLSVVDVISAEDIEACRKIAQKIGAEFRVRHYIQG